MEHYMPTIYWHDRTALLSVDVDTSLNKNKYKIVTSSVQKEVRLWEFEFVKEENLTTEPLSVTFLANLTGHNTAINQVKFSPSKEHNLLASGDCEGRITIWQLSDGPPPPPQDELPPNKENWVRFKILYHDSDVSALCWNPDGSQVASVSNDDCLCVHQALTGKRVFVLRNFRHFPNGICWDPMGKYIITMSADRKMDVIDAVKGTRLKYFSSAELPMCSLKSVEEITLEKKMYKLFHDDQLFSFQRGVTFSRNGAILAAPCARLELGSKDLFGTYIFKREDLSKDIPSAFYPCSRPTFLVKFSPVTFKLIESQPNFLGLPYRLVWASLTKDAVFFYDTQHHNPIGIVENIHYNSLTDATWTEDGRVLIVSSLEGYCSFVKFKIDVWGEVAECAEFDPPASPLLIEDKKRKKKIEPDSPSIPKVNKCSSTPKAVVTTPKTTSNTPKAITPLTKFFRAERSEKKENIVPKESPVNGDVKAKKRIQFVTLTD